jgi:outer membrane immunogenic protein
MLKTLLVGGAAALVCMTSHAVADGMAKRAPAASVACCETYNWTGAYIGLGVGGAFTTHDRSAKDIVNDYGTTYVTNLFGDHDGRSHAFGTVTLGYDHQFGRWVGGVFADYDFGNRNGHSNPADIGGFYDMRLSQKDGHAWSIGGRLGVLASPSTLLFLSAGWTRVSTEADLSFGWDGYQQKIKLDKEHDGAFVGAGIETQLGRGLSLRGEYRFTRLDDDNRKLTLEDDGYGYSRRVEFDRDLDVHSVRAVLVYKFGRREEPAPMK